MCQFRTTVVPPRARSSQPLGLPGLGRIGSGRAGPHSTYAGPVSGRYNPGRYRGESFLLSFLRLIAGVGGRDADSFR
jgi:hypothetical protein